MKTTRRFIHPKRNLALPQRQRGVVLLVILLVTLTVGGYFGARALNVAFARSGVEGHEAEQILARAKAALLAWSVITIDDFSTQGYSMQADARVGLRALRPGTLPYPDIATGITASAATTTNLAPSDGVRDQGCATRTWNTTASATLRPVATTGAIVPSATQRTSLRCFGRLPYNTLGLEQPADTSADTAGLWPWYIVSANLVSTRGECPVRFDSTLTDTALTAGTNSCGSLTTATVPFPWITVRDPYGNLISNRVAAVIILPGPPTTRQPGNVRQTRSTTALPTAYLDTVDNAACPGGRCDNALLNTSPSTAPMTFIQCVDPATTVGDTRFGSNYACNDRLTFITVDELFNHVAKRMEREFVSCLKEYFQTVNPGKYPWPAQPANPGASLVGTLPLTGSFPSIDDAARVTCPDAQARFASNSNWSGWQRAASYTLSAGQTSAQFSFANLTGRAPVAVP